MRHPADNTIRIQKRSIARTSKPGPRPLVSFALIGPDEGRMIPVRTLRELMEGWL